MWCVWSKKGRKSRGKWITACGIGDGGHVPPQNRRPYRDHGDADADYHGIVFVNAHRTVDNPSFLPLGTDPCSSI